MGSVVMNGPPDCPDRAGWCVICLMRAKQKHWEMSEEKRHEGYEAPGDRVTIIAWPNVLTSELRTGVYRGVPGEYSMLGVVDGLCWDDVAGVEPTKAPSGLLQAPGPLPPGLSRGKG